MTTDRAPVYPRLVEAFEPAARHITEQYANDRVEADYGRLKSRLRPMRGLKRLASAARSLPVMRSCKTCAAATANSSPTRPCKIAFASPSADSPISSDRRSTRIKRLRAVRDQSTQQIEEHVSTAGHVPEQYANNAMEADHGRLKARLRPMRGLKQMSSVRAISAGHAFVQTCAAHYQLTTDIALQDRVRAAFEHLRSASHRARALYRGRTSQRSVNANTADLVYLMRVPCDIVLR